MSRSLMLGLILLTSAPALAAVDSGLEDVAVVTSESTADNATFDFANGLYTRGMYESAASEYARCLESQLSKDQRASVLYRLGDCYFFLKQFDKALPVFQEYLQQFPNDSRSAYAQYRLGTCFYQTGAYEKAIEHLGISSKSSSVNLQASSLYTQAVCRQALGQHDMALESFERAYALQPENEYTVLAALQIAELRAQTQDYTTALSVYQQILPDKCPESILESSLLKAAWVASMAQDTTHAEEYYKAAYQKRASSEAALGLFEIWHAQKNEQSAYEFYQGQKSVLMDLRCESVAAYWLGRICQSTGNNARAMEMFDVALLGSELDLAIRSDILIEKIKTQLLLSQHDQALSSAELLFKEPFTDTATAFYQRAQVYEAMKNDSKALEDYRSILALESASKDIKRVALLKAAFTAQRVDDKSWAHLNFETFLRQYPSDENAVWALISLDQMDIEDKKFTDVVTRTEPLLDKEPYRNQYGTLAFKMGIACYALNDFTKAATYFEKAASDNVFEAKAQVLSALSLAYEKLQDYEAAARSLEKLISLQVSEDEFLSLNAYERLGSMYLRQAHAAQAASFFSKCVLESSGTKARLSMASVVWLIKYQLDAKQYDQVLLVLESVVPLYSSSSDVAALSFYKAEAHKGLKQYDQAMPIYQHLVETQDKSLYGAYACLRLGEVSALLKQSDKAKSFFESAVRFDEFVEVTASARMGLARLQYEQGHFADAAKTFMMVAVLYEDRVVVPEALYLAGFCYDKAGRVSDSQKAYAELKENYSESSYAQKVPSPSKKA